MTESRPFVMYYVFDALCGWCYGFSPVISQLKAGYTEDFEFKVLSGGLVTGNRVGPVGVVADYINEAYGEVEKKTGVKFGKAFLEEILAPGEAQFTSVTPAMALALFRNQLPEKQLEFALRIQRAIYYEGMPPAQWTTYGRLAEEFGLKGDEFAEKMQHPKLEELVFEEFNVAANWGIKGFPALVLQKDNQAYLVAKGYQPLAEVEKSLQTIREQMT